MRAKVSVSRFILTTDVQTNSNTNVRNDELFCAEYLIAIWWDGISPRDR